jgi:hypothetical protein
MSGRQGVCITLTALTQAKERTMAEAESAHTPIASVTDAHAHLIQRIITNKPHHMPGWHLADALDFEDRAEHLRRLLVATEDYVRAVKGRTDAAKGAVNISGLKGEALANALMKAETKAKRRATLSICGLGFLDETEVEDIPASAKDSPR